MIKISAGTAHVLGLKKLTTDAPPTTAYMMSGEKCIHDCGFCPQARNANSPSNLLSRVTWTEEKMNDIARSISSAYRLGNLKRFCLQVVDCESSLKQAMGIVEEIRRYSDIPISVSARVKTMEELLTLADVGVNRIGLALDAACERVFTQVKSGSWRSSLSLVEEAGCRLPGRISTHLIVGLGETEKEMVGMMQHMYDHGVAVGLFAFTPVPGTKLKDYPPPSLYTYRRMQAANYLIKNGLINAADCCFVDDRLVSFGLTVNQLREYLTDGRAFQTSGCPDCNRPYYNERPGGLIYNYPRPLTPVERDKACHMVIGSLEGIEYKFSI